jgi:hypothetical protein
MCKNFQRERDRYKNFYVSLHSNIMANIQHIVDPHNSMIHSFLDDRVSNL